MGFLLGAYPGVNSISLLSVIVHVFYKSRRLMPFGSVEEMWLHTCELMYLDSALSGVYHVKPIAPAQSVTRDLITIW